MPLSGPFRLLGGDIFVGDRAPAAASATAATTTKGGDVRNSPISDSAEFLGSLRFVEFVRQAQLDGGVKVIVCRLAVDRPCLSGLSLGMLVSSERVSETYAFLDLPKKQSFE